MKYLQPDWPAPAHIKAYTTLRSARNEQTDLKLLLPLPEDPVWMNQVHGNMAMEALPENRGQPADASFSAQPNRVCAVLTADCLPILICHQQGTHVAAIHAGWKGLAAGIVESTIKALDQPGNQLLAWLGPAIGPQQFEVGCDVYEAFIQQHRESDAAFTPCAKEKWLADLYALATLRLQLLGITKIYGGEFCTFTQASLFYSWRRDRNKTGRMASLIWIATSHA